MVKYVGGCRFKLISNLAVPGFLVISQACFCLPFELTVFIAEGWFSCLPLSQEVSRFTCDPLNLFSFRMSKMFCCSFVDSYRKVGTRFIMLHLAQEGHRIFQQWWHENLAVYLCVTGLLCCTSAVFFFSVF